jgi:hypothetical protein
MNRETTIIKLDFCELEVKTYLTWGESEKIDGVLFKGAKNITQAGVSDFDATILTEQKYVLLETAIAGITIDGKELKFSRDWFNNLRKEQGDQIIGKINEQLKKK